MGELSIGIDELGIRYVGKICGSFIIWEVGWNDDCCMCEDMTGRDVKWVYCMVSSV